MQRTLSSGLLFVSFVALASGCATKSNFLPAANPDQDGDHVADDLGKTVDSNADGLPDTVDLNLDGIADGPGPGVDTNGDGIADALAVDTNGDGLYDALDTTGDGQPDVFTDLSTQPSGSGGSVSATGGAAGVGGTAPGTGGDTAGTGGGTVATTRTLPEGWSGFVTAKVTDATVDYTYTDWKTHHVEDCGGGKMRVKRDASDNSDTVSEGIGYGLLLSVAHDDQALFDGLWAYYQQWAVPNGNIMPWKMSGCSGVQDSNTATDADVDAAMGLIQASCKWGGDYKAQAASLLGALSSLAGSKGGNATLKAGVKDFPEDCLNASYVAPGYYRAFAVVDAAHASTWNSLASASYGLLNGVANASTGLVPDWSGNCGNGKSANYTYDAARTPWRVATDYSWYGTAAAKTFADRMTNWVDSQTGGIGGIKDGYTLAGAITSSNRTPVFIGAFADAALAHSQERADSYGVALNIAPAPNYFARSLKALYVLLAAGKFEKSCY